MRFNISDIKSIEVVSTYTGKSLCVEIYPDANEAKDLLCNLMEDLGDEEVLKLVQEIIEENK